MSVIAKFIQVFLITVLTLSSCTILTHTKNIDNNKKISENKNKKVNNKDSFITIDELLYHDGGNGKIASTDRTVRIDKIDILEKCERSYFETQKFYKSGKLQIARVKFENILENLEYLYEDEKVSDSLMLINFISDFQNGNGKSSNNEEIDIFSLYDILFSNLDFQNEPELDNIENDNELTIEQVDNYEKERNKKSVLSIKQNNKEYLYVKQKIQEIISISNYSKKGLEDFTKKVYDAYGVYLEDKFSLQELFLRSAKFESFVKKVVKKERLNEVYSYLPAIMSSYYTGRNSGGLWQLDNTREYRKLRNDVVAATAIVLKKIKDQENLFRKNNKNEKKIFSTIISSIVSDRSYKFNSISNYYNNENEFFNSDFADFLALKIILENPSSHGLKSIKKYVNSKQIATYTKSYDKYKSNPKKYSKKISKKTNKRKRSNKNKYKKSSSNNKSYVRLKYKVRKGDFLQKIANLYKCSIKDIKRWNPKSTRGKNLYVGTVLYLRGYKFKSYKARSGDSIAKICKRNKMKMSDFMKINNMKKKTIYRGRTYYVYR